MSREKFDDNCPGCRPALVPVDPKTGALGNVVDDDSIEMRAINKVWATTTLAERAAWHHVTCLNSRARVDLRLTKPLVERFSKALEQARLASSLN